MYEDETNGMKLTTGYVDLSPPTAGTREHAAWLAGYYAAMEEGR